MKFLNACVLAWTHLYTLGMPKDMRLARRAEIESDLWEFEHDPDRARLGSAHVFVRLLLGMWNDVCWRLEQGVLRVMPQRWTVNGLTPEPFVVISAFTCSFTLHLMAGAAAMWLATYPVEERLASISKPTVGSVLTGNARQLFPAGTRSRPVSANRSAPIHCILSAQSRPYMPGRVISAWGRLGYTVSRFISAASVAGRFPSTNVLSAAQTPSLASPSKAEAFEVISIKPAGSNDSRNMRMRVLPNGDLTATAVPVLLLLHYAYDVPLNPSPRLSGFPAWRETYDIEAKPPANAVPANLPESEKRRRIQGMIRRLLVDRFKLVMRVEQKTLSVYALTVASGGPTLQKSTIAEKDCIFDTGTPESCHNFVMGRGHPLNARAINMDDLAQYIENWTDSPVVNRTALSGLFAVETKGWTPMRLPPPPPGNSPPARFDDLPTIFTVLRKLGVELKQQEATVPVYTVEHIERPAIG